jgi:membrane protein implicated in regulation of membrane protease activity
MTELMGDGNGWLILGLLLIIAEMVMSLGYVSISFGLGALVTGLLIKTDLLPTAFDTGLIDELLVTGVVSFGVLLLIRLFFKKRSPDDINKY